VWKQFTVVAAPNIFQAALNVWIASKMLMFASQTTEILANIKHNTCIL
jgi:hypothetical protein